MISLDEDGDNFVLKSNLPSEGGSQVTLSPQDLMTIAQSSQLWRERIVSKYNRQPADFSAVFASPIREVELHWDALRENILLTLIAPNGARLTYEVDKRLAHQLGESLSRNTSEIEVRKGAAQ